MAKLYRALRSDFSSVIGQAIFGATNDPVVIPISSNNNIKITYGVVGQAGEFF